MFLAISVAISSETLARRPTLSADKDQQESRAVAGKRHDAVVNASIIISVKIVHEVQT